MTYTKKYISKFKYLIDQIKNEDIENLTRIFKSCKKKKNSVFIFGNGGSASIASHVSTDLNKVCNIKSRNFNEANHITCFSNDYGYDKWISETLKIYLKKSDLVILISSSGNSKNIVNAAKYCSKKKIKLITLTGFYKKNNLRSINKYNKLNIWVNSKNYNIIENLHQIILLTAIDNLKKSNF
tara:strand:+ start:36612 stop:37160 length:549 start_codon:yes stop_codon:yes gene_type:complete